MFKTLKGFLAVALIRFLALFPLPLLRGMGVLVGKLLWWVNGDARQVTEKNLALCFPDKPAEERKRLAKNSLVESAKTAFEWAAIWLWPAHKVKSLIVDVENRELLEQAASTGRGVIVTVPHLGNWEIIGWFFPEVAKTVCLYQPPSLDELDQLIRDSRIGMGIDVAPTSIKGVSQIARTLKAGNMTGILPDQEPDTAGGEFAPFFGVPALTMTLVSNLARKTNAIVVSAYAKRVKGGFKLYFHPVDEDIYSEDDVVSLTALNQSVEYAVSQIPEQYQWEYKRFRQRKQRRSKFYKMSVEEMRDFIANESN